MSPTTWAHSSDHCLGICRFTTGGDVHGNGHPNRLGLRLSTIHLHRRWKCQMLWLWLFNRWTICGEVVNAKAAPKSTSHLICSHAVSFFPRAGSSAWQDLCVNGVVVQFLNAADSVARINVGIAIISFAISGNLVPSSIRFQKKLKIWDRISHSILPHVALPVVTPVALQLLMQRCTNSSLHTWVYWATQRSRLKLAWANDRLIRFKMTRFD